MFQNINIFGRRHTNGQSYDLSSGYADIHQHACDLERIYGHGLFCYICVNTMICNPGIDHVKFFPALAVHFQHSPVFYLDTRGRIIGALHGYQAHINPFLDKAVLVDRSFGQHFETLLSFTHFLLPPICKVSIEIWVLHPIHSIVYSLFLCRRLRPGALHQNLR